MQERGMNGTGDGRYSAKHILVQVSFLCSAPNAKKVSVIGDFNEWNPLANPMRQSADGTWRLSFSVCGGHHRYLFLIDGIAHLDPRARGVVKMEDNVKSSLGKASLLSIH